MEHVGESQSLLLRSSVISHRRSSTPWTVGSAAAAWRDPPGSAAGPRAAAVHWPFPSSIFLDKNRRDIGKSQSVWTDSKMETAGSHVSPATSCTRRAAVLCRCRRSQRQRQLHRPSVSAPPRQTLLLLRRRHLCAVVPLAVGRQAAHRLPAHRWSKGVGTHGVAQPSNAASLPSSSLALSIRTHPEGWLAGTPIPPRPPTSFFISCNRCRRTTALASEAGTRSRCGSAPPASCTPCPASAT
jgi:hypothetical protein